MALRVLVISRNYPNSATPHLGLWVDQLVNACADLCHPFVVAPIPYVPPLPGLGAYGRLRTVPLHERRGQIEVWHPRFPVGPGYALYGVEATAYYWGIRRLVDRLHHEVEFQVIHAHFSYPDGAVAARLGHRYGIPALITEHAPWVPWMHDHPRARRQAVWASEHAAFHIAVSHYVGDTIRHFAGDVARLRIIPIGVNGSIFTPLSDGQQPDPDQIVYVGRLHRIKGVDILLRAMRHLVARRPKSRLILVGNGHLYRNYRRQAAGLQQLARDLGLRRHVEFAGARPPHEAATFMRESSVLVLPSRAESFGAVLVEALACGTPVIATRCGGPEEIIDDRVGLLVPPDDPEALSRAIEDVLERRHHYDAKALRAYALGNYAYERVAQTTVGLYRQALGPPRDTGAAHAEQQGGAS